MIKQEDFGMRVAFYVGSRYCSKQTKILFCQKVVIFLSCLLSVCLTDRARPLLLNNMMFLKIVFQFFELLTFPIGPPMITVLK